MQHGAPLLLATRSSGKLKELGELLASHGLAAETLEQIGVRESVEESGLEVFDSFEENAVAKAVWFAGKTGRMVLADDSGLCVDALDGGPGVLSKRWSGWSDVSGLELDAANRACLQAALEEAAKKGVSTRRAHYECAAVCAWPSPAALSAGDVDGGAGAGAGAGEVLKRGVQQSAGGEEVHEQGGVKWIVASGVCSGEILLEERGEGGFGYDVLFASSELGGRTFAEVSVAEKERISHRGKAFGKLLERMVNSGILGK